MIPNLRKSISVFGLAFIFFLNSCANAPKLTQPKRSKQLLETQTKSIPGAVSELTSTQSRYKMELFQKALHKGKLSANDWKLHDELLDQYIYLKQTNSSKVTIPSHSKITVPLETYCLNASRAPPAEQEVYHWQKSDPDIKYYSELLSLRRKGEIAQADLQELLWNLGSETRWDDYPERLKAILQKVDPRASVKLPSQLKDRATNLITDSIVSLPGASEAIETYHLIKGKYYTYEDFKKSVESLTSNHDLSDYDTLTKIPGTELYSQSQSQGYNNQMITFYNPTDKTQELDLTEYYLAPERKDVQRIGINPIVRDPTLLSDLEKLLYETMARLGIGFTPMLGDVADLYEMIYGKDFLTGRPLDFYERLASAVGIALGSGSAYRQAKRWIYAPPEYLPKFESELAKTANKTLGPPNYEGAKRALDNGHIVAYKLGKGLDFKGTQELSKFLRDSEIERKFRVQTVQSFEPGSIKRRVVENDEIVYRWHNGDEDVRQFGRYVSQERIEEKAIARTKLALPSENHLKYFDSFSLKKGTIIFEGSVAPFNGQPGGGRQILIPGDLQKALKLQGRVN
jgi:hypothetical protein